MPGYLRPHIQTMFPGPVGPNPDGGPGWYWVELTLYPHPVLYSETDATSLRNDFIGDSLISLLDPLPDNESRKHVFTIELMNTDLAYFVYCNEKGRLSHFNIKLQSKCFDEAINVAEKNLQPFLSGWATRFNIPIHVFRIRAIEESTNVSRNILYPQLYKPVSVSYDEINRLYYYPKDTRAISFYREALNATSVKYQFLCYFKIIELVLGLRGKRAAKAKPEGEKNVRRREVIPDEEWFRSHLAPDLQARLIGKKFTAIRDDVLRPIRTRIAHGLLDDQMDDDISDDEIYPYMPVAKFMAERFLSTELEEQQLASHRA